MAMRQLAIAAIREAGEKPEILAELAVSETGMGRVKHCKKRRSGARHPALSASTAVQLATTVIN